MQVLKFFKAGYVVFSRNSIYFFFVFILTGKKEKGRGDIELATWLFFIGLHLLFYYFFITQLNFKYTFLLGLEIPMPLLHGPFLFLYVSALTNQNQGKRYFDAVHFIPFLAGYLLLFSFFLLPVKDKINVYKAEGKPYELLMTIFLFSFIFSGILYTLLSLQKLKLHRKKIKDYFSETEMINLKWLLYLIIGLSVIWVLVVIGDEKYLFSAVVFYVLFIGYFGIKQVGIFTNSASILNHRESLSLKIEKDNLLNKIVEHKLSVFPEIKETNQADDVPAAISGNVDAKKQPEKVKYEKSGLRMTSVQEIHRRLTDLMQKEKLYKNPELTLTDLAKIMQVHPNILSQVINTMENSNFYDYINFQRIEEFKEICVLPENQKFTLLTLAFECGFNSKTAFNRNFKKATSVSPTEYLKSTTTKFI